MIKPDKDQNELRVGKCSIIRLYSTWTVLFWSWIRCLVKHRLVWNREKQCLTLPNSICLISAHSFFKPGKLKWTQLRPGKFSMIRLHLMSNFNYLVEYGLEAKFGITLFYVPIILILCASKLPLVIILLSVYVAHNTPGSVLNCNNLLITAITDKWSQCQGVSPDIDANSFLTSKKCVNNIEYCLFQYLQVYINNCRWLQRPKCGFHTHILSITSFSIKKMLFFRYKKDSTVT